MGLTSVITKRYKTYTLKTYSESYVKGKLTKVESTQEIELCIIPVDMRAMAESPEGTYDIQDIKIYYAGSDIIPERSIIEYKGRDYSIRSLSNREDNGGFQIYIGKLIDE